MEWVNTLRGSVVGIDTAPLIYFIEEQPRYLPHLRAFFEAVDRREVRVVTSVVTITEVLIHPLRKSNFRLADEYRRILLQSETVQTLPVSAIIAEEAARIRAKHNFRIPDAIQLATAITEGAAGFLTNDVQLAVPFVLRTLVLDQVVATD